MSLANPSRDKSGQKEEKEKAIRSAGSVML